jgi:hypothetical protein
VISSVAPQAPSRSATAQVLTISGVNFSDGLSLTVVEPDQVVPIGASGLASAKIVTHATLKVYAVAPHGLVDSHRAELGSDLLAFVRE